MLKEIPLEVCIKLLRGQFERAWCRQTTYVADFDPKIPSRGQCYVTALCVQDILDGEVVQGKVDGINHFWNNIRGEEFDLTSDQFGGDGIHRVKRAKMSNKFLYPNRKNKRYLLLKRLLSSS
jgi:hypothetical protein